MLRKLAFLSEILFCASAYGHAIHVAGNAFQLDTEKHTSPALGVRIGDQIFYGAFYPGTAPGVTMHVRTDSEYWLGQNCPAGTYSETGMSACTDCSYGYYCGGGAARTVCTYGAISCNGKTHSSDAPRVDGAPINQLLTLDEVNEFMPVTNASLWREVSCCFSSPHLEANPSNPSELNNVANACATGTIGPGTYLFITHYANRPTSTDSITGGKSISKADIVVFDHPVSYASIHGNSIFQHFIDTEHPTYTEYTFSTVGLGKWQQDGNANNTNIPDIINLLSRLGSRFEYYLCVYELK